MYSRLAALERARSFAVIAPDRRNGGADPAQHRLARIDRSEEQTERKGAVGKGFGESNVAFHVPAGLMKGG
jgi:hypothetical protein